MVTRKHFYACVSAACVARGLTGVRVNGHVRCAEDDVFVEVDRVAAAAMNLPSLRGHHAKNKFAGRSMPFFCLNCLDLGNGRKIPAM